MNIESVASALIAAQAARLQMAAAAKLMREDVDASAAAGKLLQSARENLANAAAGIGGRIDITL